MTHLDLVDMASLEHSRIANELGDVLQKLITKHEKLREYLIEEISNASIGGLFKSNKDEGYIKGLQKILDYLDKE